MATVDETRLIHDLNLCCDPDDYADCSSCFYFNTDDDCQNHLMQEAREEIIRLQNIVNEYAKYNGFLAAHGLFKTVEVPFSSEEDAAPLPKDEDHGYIVTITR